MHCSDFGLSSRLFSWKRGGRKAKDGIFLGMRLPSVCDLHDVCYEEKEDVSVVMKKERYNFRSMG